MCVYTGARFAGTMHMFRHNAHLPIYYTPGAPSYDTLIDDVMTRSIYYVKPCN